MDQAAQGIYLITTEDRYPTKIGITGDLKLRLMSLQGGNWERLHAVEFGFVVDGRWKDRPKNAFAGLDAAALNLESAVHRKMRELELSMIGEWANVTADDAWAVVRKVADQIGVEIVGIEVLERLHVQGAMHTSLLAAFYRMIEAEKSAREAIDRGRHACGYLTSKAS